MFFPHHTLVMRPAPRTSKLHGSATIYCELHCPVSVAGEKLLACQPLKELGIEYHEEERVLYSNRTHKLLRFTVPDHDRHKLILLFNSCKRSDVAGYLMETKRHIKSISDNLENLGIRELRKLGTGNVKGASRMNKQELLEQLQVA